MRRAILTLTCALLCGCDVATAALLVGGNKKSSDDGPPLTSPDPTFDLFRAYVGNIADPDQEEFNLIQATQNGEFPSTTWTEIGLINNNTFFNPSLAPDQLNAILILTSSAQNYELDCVELLDELGNTVLDDASGQTWSNLINNPDNLLEISATLSICRAACQLMESCIPSEAWEVHWQATTTRRVEISIKAGPLRCTVYKGVPNRVPKHEDRLNPSLRMMKSTSSLFCSPLIP